jgi:adenosylcobyric acid synthase
LVDGLVVNKFRGDRSLFSSGVDFLEERSGLPVLGVIPFLPDHGLPDEDSASYSSTPRSSPLIEVCSPRFPRLANFDDLLPLARGRGVSVRFVDAPDQLRAPDLIVLPGTKATLPDLEWLWERGLGERIRYLAARGTPVIGICGGFQMLGTRVSDPEGIESAHVQEAPGLGLLPVETTLAPEKRLGIVRGTVTCAELQPWASLTGQSVRGYEIHVGRSHGDVAPFIQLDNGTADGAMAGTIAGSYVHGLFDSDGLRHALLAALAHRNGLNWQGETDNADTLDSRLDRVADALEATLDVGRVLSLVGLGKR